MKQTYRTLAERGKPGKVAVVAIMRKLLVLANVLIKQDRLWTPQRPQAHTKQAIGHSPLPMHHPNTLRRNPTGQAPKGQTTHPSQLAHPYLWLPMLDNMDTPRLEGRMPSFPALFPRSGAALEQQVEQHQNNAGGNCRIGDVEGRKGPAAVMQRDKVQYVAARNTIDNIAHRAAGHQRQAQRPGRIAAGRGLTP